MAGRIRVSDKVFRTVDGITFASMAEMNRYCYLRLLERIGEITELELQPAFVLQEAHVRGGERIRKIVYKADFRYREKATGKVIVEDVKGHRTDVYRLKMKLLLGRYPGINFKEVKA